MGKQPTMATHATRHSGPPAQVQLPLEHPSEVPESHDAPHAPQLLTSRDTSTHELEQQRLVAPQVRPHAPQLVAVERLWHVPLQQALPAPHPAAAPHMHRPPTHISPAPHAGMHVVVMHLPVTHDWPVMQRVPHMPQLLLSVIRFAHMPPGQHDAPAAHVADAPHRQLPPTHVSPVPHAGTQGDRMQVPAVHSSPMAHACPQVPQFAVSVCELTHAAPQHVCPSAHTSAEPHLHMPEKHALPRGAQVRPQPPQLF